MKRRKAKDQPPKKDHSPERVKEVALMLYERRPFPLESHKVPSDFELLFRQAFQLLDELDRAYAIALNWRERQLAERAEAQRRRAFSLKLSKLQWLTPNGDVPFDTAVKIITGQTHQARALARFEPLPLFLHPDKFRAAIGQAPTSQLRWQAQLSHWRKNGMTRDEVIGLYSYYAEGAYRRYRIKTADKPKKRRKPRFKKKDKSVIREIYRDKVERDINVSDEQAKQRFRPRKSTPPACS